MSPVPFVPPVGGAEPHRELHAIMTVLLSGDSATAGRLISQTRWPHLVLGAAVNEMVVLLAGVAEIEGMTPVEAWRNVCEMFEASALHLRPRPPDPE